MEIKVSPEFAIEIVTKLIKSDLPFILEHTKNHTIIVASKEDLESVQVGFGKLKLVKNTEKPE